MMRLMAIFVGKGAVPDAGLQHLVISLFQISLFAVFPATIFVLIFWFAKSLFLDRWILYGTIWWFVSVLGISCVGIGQSGDWRGWALRTTVSFAAILVSAYLVNEIYNRTVEISSKQEKSVKNKNLENSGADIDREVQRKKRQRDKRTWNIFVIFLGLEIAGAFFFMTFLEWSYGAPSTFEVPDRDSLLIIGAIALFFIVFPVFNSIRSNALRDDGQDQFKFNRVVSASLLYSMAFLTNLSVFLNIIFDGSQMTIGMVFGPLLLAGVVVSGILGIQNFLSLVANFPRKISPAKESHC
jgi:hypothetical protein